LGWSGEERTIRYQNVGRMSSMRDCDATNAEQKSVVLVVEDEVVIRLETVLAIKDAGYAVLAAGNADEAMAVLKTRDDISAVFTEIRIPGHRNGLDLGRAIADRWPLVRLIMTSGDRRRENIPADWHYIQKPYCGSQIIDALRTPAPLAFAG
jgi:DNA-binding NtrC family response regulator